VWKFLHDVASCYLADVQAASEDGLQLRSAVFLKVGPSWFPELGRLLASAGLLYTALEPGTDCTHGSSIATTNAFCIQAPAQDAPVPALN